MRPDEARASLRPDEARASLRPVGARSADLGPRLSWFEPNIKT